MLEELIDSSNFLCLNLKSIQIFGLTTAAYFDQLVQQSKKSKEEFFKVNRESIKKLLGITKEEQEKCDSKLKQVDVITKERGNADSLQLNVEKYVALLTDENAAVIKEVKKAVKTTDNTDKKQQKRDAMIKQLKEAVETKNYDVLIAMRNWIDSIVVSPDKYMTPFQVKLFKNELDEYCKGDVKKALEIIKLATIHAYIDCRWAINSYENNNKFVKTVTSTSIQQKQTTNVGSEIF